MARARNIKPSFFRNADLVELPMEARLLFIGLWTLADRAGRLEDRPKQIKMDVFPADSVDVNALLDELASTGMVARYEVNGTRYLQVVNFAKHQNPHRDEKASTLPDQNGNIATPIPASGKHGANTVQAQCDPDAPSVAIGLNPDSLIPDSPNLDTPSVEGVPRASPGEVCKAMKAVGLQGLNPSHPTLTTLLDAGMALAELVAAAEDAVAKQKPFAYALAVAEGRRRDAAMAPLPEARAGPIETAYERAQRERMAEFAPRVARKAPGQPAQPIDLEILDVPAIASH